MKGSKGSVLCYSENQCREVTEVLCGSHTH